MNSRLPTPTISLITCPSVMLEWFEWMVEWYDVRWNHVVPPGWTCVDKSLALFLSIECTMGFLLPRGEVDNGYRGCILARYQWVSETIIFDFTINWDGIILKICMTRKVKCIILPHCKKISHFKNKERYHFLNQFTKEGYKKLNSI